MAEGDQDWQDVGDDLDELFDVVDADDRVIGTAPRWRVHRDGLKHRAIHVLLWNDTGKVYLQLRSAQKDTHPGCWDSSCSGHLDAGEGYLEAAVRELGEELGLRVGRADLEEEGRIAACGETGNEFVAVYRLFSSVEPQPDPDEIAEGRWFEGSEVESLLGDPRWPAAPAFRLIWRKLFHAD
ncbi:MAG: NUDIX domain-containing protein [Puniceicoccaceae bacterium]